MAKYWTKQHLHVSRGDEAYFSRLFSADNFSAALRQMPDEVGMGTYDKGFNNTAQKYDTLCGAFMDGGGIVINAFNRGWAALSQLCAELQGMFYMTVMNLYLTPRQAQTFTAHTDPQDVFILQMSGYKAWKLYRTPVAVPFEEQQVGKQKDRPIDMVALGDPIDSLVLRPGDVLYIPRGTPHWCNTESEASLHLTLTMPTSDWSWGNFLSNAVNNVVRREEALREAMPLSVLHLGENAPELQELAAEFETRMKDVLGRLTFEEGLQRTQDHILHREHEKAQELQRLEKPDVNIRAVTEVVKLPEVAEVSEQAPVAGKPGKIMVTTFHRSLPMRAVMRRAVQFIEDKPVGERFTVGQIPHADAFEQICMTEMLFKMGWLNITQF